MQHRKQMTFNHEGYEIKLDSTNQTDRLYMAACKRVNVYTKVRGKWFLFLVERVNCPTHVDAIKLVFNVVKKRIEEYTVKEGGNHVETNLY